MSILETFVLLFDSNADDLKKGTTEAKKTTDALEKSLKSADAITAKVGAGFSNLIRQASGAFLAIFSAGTIIAGVKAAQSYSIQLHELSKVLGVNIEQLGLWGDAVELNGGSAQEFQSTVRTMTAHLQEFATKGESRAAPFFQQLGIRMTDASGKARNFIDLLPELADKFSKLSKSESFGIGEKLGLDQSTILLLQQGRQEVDAIIRRHKELGAVTKEDAEIAHKFNQQWGYTALAFRSLFVTINSSILPVFTSLLNSVEKFVTFMRRHSHFLEGSIIAIGTALTVFVIPALVAAVAAAAPFLIIGGAIAAMGLAFALVYDDIRNFYKGNLSVLGVLMEKWPIVGKIFKFIENEVRGVIRIFKTLVETVLWAFEKLQNFGKAVKSFLGFGDTNANLVVEQAQKATAQANSTPLNSQNSTTISSATKVRNRITNVSTGPITIETKATDAKGIAGDLGKNLNNQMRQAVNDLDDGVMA